SWRRTRITGEPRGIFCGIGACYDCLVTIDGVPDQRACLIPARPGSVVSTQDGAAAVGRRAGLVAAAAPQPVSCDVAVDGAGSAGGGSVVHAARVVLATGGYDRVPPFRGWTLPGVVTAGGAQAMLKGSGVAIGQRVVVAGAGPLLLPVAVGLARAGAR